MTDSPHIRRRLDGSIDTTHHALRGRVCRSAAAHEMIGAIMRAARKPVLGLAVVVTLLPFLRGQC